MNSGAHRRDGDDGPHLLVLSGGQGVFDSIRRGLCGEFVRNCQLLYLLRGRLLSLLAGMKDYRKPRKASCGPVEV